MHNSVKLCRCPEATQYIARVECQMRKKSMHCRLDAVKNKQEFPDFREHMWVEKLADESMIHYETWNIANLK